MHIECACVDFIPAGVKVLLPEPGVGSLDQILFPLHRQIDSLYRELPWPSKIKKIIVVTEVQGGRGDVAAAAKVISFMKMHFPDLSFDWILKNLGFVDYEPLAFLECKDRSKITKREFFDSTKILDKTPGDLLIQGPTRPLSTEYIERYIERKISGPMFGFLENGEKTGAFFTESINCIIKKAPEKTASNMYTLLHPRLFPSQFTGVDVGLIPMGLQEGSGVFLDQTLLAAPLSRRYCCPSYLSQIEDAALRKDILESMNILDGESIPDYERYSFNSGYAHRSASLGKFIDCVAIHEKKKNVVVVLNQKGAFEDLKTEQLQLTVFTEGRLDFLKIKGFKTIILKGQNYERVLANTDCLKHRSLTLIVRQSFNPADMKRMQLASERLLATGDNSAVEAWCAKCILYLYEDVDNMGCKNSFLQQQVDIAKKINPNLSKLLALFGGDTRVPGLVLNKPLSKEKMGEIECLLNDPLIGAATEKFCKYITRKYSFSDVLVGGLKRTVWHHCIPELSGVESEELDEDFRVDLIRHLRGASTDKKIFTIQRLNKMGERIQRVVKNHL